MNGVANSFAGFDGFKGYMGGVNYTFVKNITGLVEYYDLEGRNEDVHARTVYSRLQFAF